MREFSNIVFCFQCPCSKSDRASGNIVDSCNQEEKDLLPATVDGRTPAFIIYFTFISGIHST